MKRRSLKNSRNGSFGETAKKSMSTKIKFHLSKLKFQSWKANTVKKFKTLKNSTRNTERERMISTENR